MSEMASQPYWVSHPYNRLSVKKYVEEFVGWTALKQLVNYAESGRDRGFLSALFESGGRVREVLALEAENFSILPKENLIIVRNMKLSKRYKKLEDHIDELGHKHWITELIPSIRKPFPILLGEPLAQILYDFLQGKHGLLFPSPYKAKLPLTRSWAYKLVRGLDSSLPVDLKKRLGLDRAFQDREGHKISDSIHLWLHWFRSQRASQLVSDYGFELLDLIDYFSWESERTAIIYARKGWRGLSSKMLSVQTHYV